MAFQDKLGERMKNNYENISKTRLMRRTPVAVRIDGRAFHSYTRGFEKPFDPVLVRSIQDTMKYLCENIQNCIFGFCQSDEITLILVDYQTFETEAFFDYEVQKLCSIIASMATMKFNQVFDKNYLYTIGEKGYADEYDLARDMARKKGAMFDCRVFNIPKEEVVNLVYWRQLDAMRNSIQMVGQANFSHKELQGKSCENIVNMLTEKGINYDEYPVYLQRGSACRKSEENWRIDLNMPILKGEDRKYLEDLIHFE